MITFLARMKVKEGIEPDFVRLQTELSKLAHSSEPGLLVYDVIRHTENPSTYVVYARVKDQAAFDFHQEADFHQRLVPLILDRVEGEMDLQFFEWVA